MGKYVLEEKQLDSDAPILAQRVNNRLIELKMTREELAQKAGVAKSTITAMLQSGKNGYTDPRASSIINIAKALHVSTDYLLGLTAVKSLDSNLQAAQKFTGLSETALERLPNLSEHEKEFASYFLSDTLFVQKLTKTASDYYASIDKAIDAEQRYNLLPKDIKINKPDEKYIFFDDAKGLAMFQLSRLFEKFMEKSYGNFYKVAKNKRGMLFATPKGPKSKKKGKDSK